MRVCVYLYVHSVLMKLCICVYDNTRVCTCILPCFAGPRAEGRFAKMLPPLYVYNNPLTRTRLIVSRVRAAPSAVQIVVDITRECVLSAATGRRKRDFKRTCLNSYGDDYNNDVIM